MAHKGKATSYVDYNPEDPPSAYSNATVHSRLSEYTSMAKVVHGPDYDPSTQDFDGQVVMRVGGGKKHVRYWLGDGIIDTATTPSLSDPGKKHELKPRHTTSAEHCTAPDGGTPGYFCFIHFSLIFRYLTSAIL